MTTTGDCTVRVTCDQRHCDDEHAEIDDWREPLREAIGNLATAYHEAHDTRFPWSLCSWDACREAAIALGLRHG